MKFQFFALSLFSLPGLGLENAISLIRKPIDLLECPPTSHPQDSWRNCHFQNQLLANEQPHEMEFEVVYTFDCPILEETQFLKGFGLTGIGDFVYKQISHWGLKTEREFKPFELSKDNSILNFIVEPKTMFITGKDFLQTVDLDTDKTTKMWLSHRCALTIEAVHQRLSANSVHALEEHLDDIQHWMEFLENNLGFQSQIDLLMESVDSINKNSIAQLRKNANHMLDFIKANNKENASSFIHLLFQQLQILTSLSNSSNQNSLYEVMLSLRTMSQDCLLKTYEHIKNRHSELMITIQDNPALMNTYQNQVRTIKGMLEKYASLQER